MLLELKANKYCLYGLSFYVTMWGNSGFRVLVGIDASFAADYSDLFRCSKDMVVGKL